MDLAQGEGSYLRTLPARAPEMLDSPMLDLLDFAPAFPSNEIETAPACWIFVGFPASVQVRTLLYCTQHVQGSERVVAGRKTAADLQERVGGDGFEPPTPAL